MTMLQESEGGDLDSLKTNPIIETGFDHEKTLSVREADDIESLSPKQKEAYEVLKSLITTIIEDEIATYLNSLYREK